MINILRHFILCDCGSPEHQMTLAYDENEKPEWQQLFLTIHLVEYDGFLKRLIAGIKYIFGYRSKYGHFDELVINPDEAKKIIEFIEGFVEKSKLLKNK